MTQITADTDLGGHPPFEEHLRVTVGALRSAILEMMSSVGADPGRPQLVARQLGLRTGLNWKVCKVAQEADVHAAVTHIPGPTGLKLFVDAFENAGATASATEAVRKAGREFERMVEIHAGDRPTLEMMVADMSATSAFSEQSRRLAYQGNSGTWGVCARTLLSLNLMAPNEDDPSQCDLAQVAGYLDFKRLRRTARWLMFRHERWTDKAPIEQQDTWEPLDADGPDQRSLPLLREFCSQPLPEIDVIKGPGENQYELPPGPVGNTAALTCIYGSISRAVGPTHATKDDDYAEIGANIMTPCEHMLLDVLVHRDFEWAMQPKLQVYGRMDGGGLHGGERRERNVLPIAQDVHDLGWGAAAMATAYVPSYPRMLAFVYERLGRSADDFRAFRVSMPYPPIPSVALLRCALPVRS